ncbi:hypothetical protein BPAE_0170g00170 [Botrytis paeoniae]|uniref:Uncharacterized protein n=1 Tax=Botrytis paeoniae TaxID=278948 RepID=A0A4Z1FC49_9HELO|nr:hypothetical protein BPAE_0170g00170 [Botrytis paeoniae]
MPYGRTKLRKAKKPNYAKADKAAKQQERRESRIAEANAAEVTRLLANEALQLARRIYALRLRDPRVGGDYADGNEEENEYEDDGEEEDPETIDEFRNRVLGWYGVHLVIERLRAMVQVTVVVFTGGVSDSLRIYIAESSVRVC